MCSSLKDALWPNSSHYRILCRICCRTKNILFLPWIRPPIKISITIKAVEQLNRMGKSLWRRGCKKLACKQLTSRKLFFDEKLKKARNLKSLLSSPGRDTITAHSCWAAAASQNGVRNLESLVVKGLKLPRNIIIHFSVASSRPEFSAVYSKNTRVYIGKISSY